jgi:hypothetical protein
MPAPQSPSTRSSRTRSVVALAALVVVGVAAQPSTQPSAQPPAQPPVGSDSAASDATGRVDSLALQDSLAPLAADSMLPAAPVAPVAPVAAAPSAAPAAWPVDPATGQTLINGKPVVGRVFIMQKTDGTVKYPNVADVIAHEAHAPLPAVVGASYTPAPLANTRRMRGMMVQSTLWGLDAKRSATELRYYRGTTSAP